MRESIHASELNVIDISDKLFRHLLQLYEQTAYARTYCEFAFRMVFVVLLSFRCIVRKSMTRVNPNK